MSACLAWDWWWKVGIDMHSFRAAGGFSILVTHLSKVYYYMLSHISLFVVLSPMRVVGIIWCALRL